MEGADEHLQGGWTPEAFIDNFGDKDVTLINNETEATMKSTVRFFFKLFGVPREDSIGWKLKVSAVIPVNQVNPLSIILHQGLASSIKLQDIFPSALRCLHKSRTLSGRYPR